MGTPVLRKPLLHFCEVLDFIAALGTGTVYSAIWVCLLSQPRNVVDTTPVAAKFYAGCPSCCNPAIYPDLGLVQCYSLRDTADPLWLGFFNFRKLETASLFLS